MSRDDCGECSDKQCGRIRFRETWSEGGIYRPGDPIPLNGSRYVAIYPNQNDPPPSPNWALLAAIPGKKGLPVPSVLPVPLDL